MSQKALRNAQRVLRYEQQQFKLMLPDIARKRADISNIERRICILRQQVANILNDDASDYGNELQRREIIIDYSAQVDVQVSKLQLEKERLTAELVAAEQNLIGQRARVKSIETLVKRAQTALVKEQEFHANIELSDLLVGGMEETS